MEKDTISESEKKKNNEIPKHKNPLNKSKIPYFSCKEFTKETYKKNLKNFLRFFILWTALLRDSKMIHLFCMYGGPAGARTRDLKIKSLPLYQLSYESRNVGAI